MDLDQCEIEFREKKTSKDHPICNGKRKSISRVNEHLDHHNSLGKISLIAFSSVLINRIIKIKMKSRGNLL